MTGPYDDIIGLPHHVSNKHPHMKRLDRAAQFSPFAALTGYGAAIEETARRTSERLELDEYEKAVLNGRLQTIAERLNERPEAAITYFRPDEKKDGGAYVTAAGPVKKLNAYERIVVMADGTRIPIEDIIDIQGELFRE